MADSNWFGEIMPFIEQSLGADFTQAVQSTALDNPLGGDVTSSNSADPYSGGTNTDSWLSTTPDTGTNAGGGFDAAAYVGLDASRNPSAPIGTASRVEEGTVLSKIKDFAKMVEENKALTKMVLDGIGGAVAQRNKAKSDQMLLQQKADLEAAAVALKRQNNSASVSGLKPIQRTGLLGQPLKRTTGQNVFKPTGGLLGSAG